MNHHVYRDPLKAIGNAEDPRVVDPDEMPASLVGLNRGILAALQAGGGGGGGGSGTLPPGAATAANQSAGNSLLTSIDSKMTSPLPAGTNVIGGVSGQYNTTPPTAANGQQVALQTDVNGRLLIAGAAGGGGDATAANQVASQAPVAPGAATATKSQLMGGQYNAAAPAVADGQQVSLQVGSNGQLLIGALTGSTGLAKAEDVTHTNGATGVMTLGVRKDTAVSTADADGDYVPLITDAEGRLWVHVGASEPGTNLMGKVSAAADTSTIYNGTTVLTPKFAVIDHAVSGDNTIVPVVASKKIRVLSLFLVAAGAVNVRFESGASGTALTGQMNLPTNGGFVLPYNPIGWFETAAGALLNLELSAAVSVDGSLAYVEV